MKKNEIKRTVTIHSINRTLREISRYMYKKVGTAEWNKRELKKLAWRL
jgi:hypothetical protein